jgi:hypothetical protein
MKNIHILSFDSFSSPLLENVEAAKNFLYKIAKYKKANPTEEIKNLEQLKGSDLRGIDLDSKEKEKALDEFRFEGGKLRGKPVFATVKEFLEKKNSPSYTYPFVYFALEMPTLEIGLSDSELDKKIKEIENSDKNERQKELEIENLTKNLDFSNLLRKLAQQKQIKDRFPLPYVDPEGYIRAKEKGDIEGMPAIEKLNDDLDEKLREMKVDQFFGNHAPIIKDYFRKEILKKKNESPAMKKLYDEVFNTIWPILKLEHKEGTIKVFARDRHGNRTEEILREYPNRAENVLLSQSGMYKDTRTYPELSDKSKPEVAFQHFLDNAKGVQKGWSKSVHQIINDLENQSPAVKILHIFTKDNIILTSARTWYGISEVCRITSSALCIQQQTQWESYTTGRLQISINQMELDQNAENALLTYTINPDLTVYDYGDKNNRRPLLSTRNKHLSWYLEKEGVPHRKEIIDIISKNVHDELRIKKILDTIYKEIGSTNKKGGNVLSFLGATWIQTQIEKNEISQKEWEKLFGIVSGAIKKEFKFTVDEVKSYFEEKGFSTLQDFLIYEDFMGSDFNWDDAEKIYQNTIEAMELLNDVHGFGDDVQNTLKAILEEFPKVEEVFRTRIIPDIKGEE